MNGVRPPRTATGAASRNDRRNREKLWRSPGSFFMGRSSELALAAPYFRRKLRELSEGFYNATANAHYYNLCAASYTAMLSAFEMAWKALFAGIVDATVMYDEYLMTDSRTKNVVGTEGILAHREEGSAGRILSASLGTWQRADVVNENFKALCRIEPMDKSDSLRVNEFWQVRHIVAHNAGVVGNLDAYRLAGKVNSQASLQIDEDYLVYTLGILRRVVRDGVDRVSTRVLSDFFDRRASGDWETDGEEFAALFMLGLVVPKTHDLPTVTEADYARKKKDLQP